MSNQKGSRKIGHNAKRSVAMARYRLEGRMNTNKKRRIETDKRRKAAIKARKIRKGLLDAKGNPFPKEKKASKVT